MTNDKLIAGLKVLVVEANAHLEDIRKDLDEAIKREKRATREGRWDAILCERDKISKLLDREFIHLGQANSNLARIAQLQAEAKLMSDYRIQVLQELADEQRAKLRKFEWLAGNAWGDVRKAYQDRADDIRDEIKDLVRQIRGEDFTYES